MGEATALVLCQQLNEDSVLTDDLAEIVEISLEEFDQEVLDIAGPEKLTTGELARKIYREQGFPCILVPAPRFLQETGLKLLDLFPGPLNRENIKLLRYQNTVEVNDAKKSLKI